ncbi:MAG TPA: glycosyltransferase family 4 protein [Kiritimatiellia bacterium]|nr:glycosyltransferase family 4 protein [Kiritimatiellia bacterium]
MTKGEPPTFRLLVIETHPIQYKAPLFRSFASDPRFRLKVWYAMLPDARQQGEGFESSFSWDVPLLDGYDYEVLDNRSARPSVVRWGGCDTPEVHRKLKVERPDAVLVNGWVTKTCVQALMACRRLGIPCLVRGEANDLRLRAGWKRLAQRLLLSQYQAYLAIGSANRRFYLARGCREERIFDAPYAVDNEAFEAAVAERVSRRNALRAAWEIPDDRIVFLFAGKVEEKKRPLDLLRAVHLLPPEYRSRAHVLIAGTGPREEDCRAEAARLGVQVSWAGFLNQSRMPDAYAASDVLVLPSDTGETWGLVVNEAMASGLPALVSQSVGCREDLIVEGVTGGSFPEGDLEGLAALMRGYLDQPDSCLEQGRAARRRVDWFCFRRIRDGIHDALCAVVKTP